MAAQDVKDLVSNAMSEAEGVSDAAPEVAPPNDDAGGDEGTPAAEEIAAPAADAWTPPTREEVEALRKQAKLGERFTPYADQIDGILRERLAPRQAEQKPAATPEQIDDYAALFGKGAAKKWAADAAKALQNDDPSVLLKGYEAIVDRRVKARIDAIDEQFRKWGPALSEMAGRILTSDKRYVQTPEWKKIGPTAEEYATKHNVDFETAWKFASDRAELDALKAGASPQKAAAIGAAAGQQAAAAVAGAPAGVAPRPPSAPRKPGPRDEPALRTTGAGKGKPGSEKPFDPKKSKNYYKDMVGSAWDAHGGAR